MKIYIDINHPAHVHYFRNFITQMKNKGHEFIITNRDAPIINQLLDFYRIPHYIRNKRPQKQSFLSSISYLLGMIKSCIFHSLKTCPDIYLGFAASQCAIASFFFRKPCILLDDTEHNKMNHTIYKPFASVILTPFYFKKNLGKKQLYFNAYIEQLYLHSKYYNQNSSNLQSAGLHENESYALIRYISYDATHDSKVQPLPENVKKELLLKLNEKMKTFVSLESGVKDEFYDKYKIRISPEKMHDIMAGASVLLSEGATMASESCMLGVPFVYINPLQKIGYILQQIEDYPEVAAESINAVIIGEKLAERTNNIFTPEQKESVREKIEQTTINPTDFLVWFVENYPTSIQIIKKDSDFQYNFR